MGRFLTKLPTVPTSTVIVVLYLLAGLLLLLPGLPTSSGADRVGIRVVNPFLADVTAATSPRIDPTKVMKAQACATCHKLEFAAWKRTKHHDSIETKLNPADANVRKYCRTLGIEPASVQKNLLCVSCHATPQADSTGNVRAVSGVSCESCHGAAGGQEGWLNRHAVYGPNGTRSSEETVQYRYARLALTKNAGMIRSFQIYEIAKKCLGCHLVGNEKLVAAGHPAGSIGFDLATWSAGEVRHNFHVEVQRVDTRNAKVPQLWAPVIRGTAERRARLKYVIGMLADLELSLRHRANAKSSVFVAQVGGRVGSLYGKLGEMSDTTLVVAEISRLRTRIGAAFGRLFALRPDDQRYYNALADMVSVIAKRYSRRHDGSGLAGLDPIIHAIPAKGTVFQPWAVIPN